MFENNKESTVAGVEQVGGGGQKYIKGKTDNSVKYILPPGYPEIRGHWRVSSKEIKTRVFTGSLLLLCLADEGKKKTAVGQLYKQENPLKGDCSNPDKK